MGQSGEEVSSEQAGKDESDDGGEKDGDADGGEAGQEVGAGFADFVDGVESLLNGGDTNRSGPYRCNQAEGEFARGGGGGGLVEGVKDCAEGVGGKDQGEVVEELGVDGGGGAGGKAKERAGAKEGWEESKEEVETQLRGTAEEIIGEEGLPGSFGDYADGNALKIPKGVERRAGDIVPDALLPWIGRFVEGGVGADGVFLSLPIASSALIDAEGLGPGGRG